MTWLNRLRKLNRRFWRNPLEERLDVLEYEARQLGHDVKNIRARIDPLRKLVLSMQEDQYWRRRPIDDRH